MKNIKYSLLAKIVAYFLIVISTCLTFASIIGGYVLFDFNFYTQTPTQIKNYFFEGISFDNVNYIMDRWDNGEAEHYLASRYEETNFSYEIFDSNNKKMGGNHSGEETVFTYEHNYYNYSVPIEDSLTTEEASPEIREGSKGAITPSTENGSIVREEKNLGYDSNSSFLFAEEDTVSVVLKEEVIEEVMKDIDEKENPQSNPPISTLQPVDSTKSSLPENNHEFILKFYIDDNFTAVDRYSRMNDLIDFAHFMRYGVIGIFTCSFLVTMILFIFLMCSAGYKKGYETVQLNSLTRIPFDLLTGLIGFVSLFFFHLAINITYSLPSYFNMVFIGIVIIFFIVLAISFCGNFAARVKAGHLWKNTLFYRLFSLTYNIFRNITKALYQLLADFPYLWKTNIIVVAYIFVQFLFIYILFNHSQSIFLFLWFIEKIFLLSIFIYFAILLYRLQKGCKMLAYGDLAYQVNTSYMFWELKAQGENLNSIGECMTLAVETRLKTERLKTELITNVSHDIKTPLTSIINYIDLISKEDTENDTIKEYTEVLIRQSNRLKKLIEDLVEASKVSTGNIDVELVPCEIGVLLTQSVGEYQQRMEALSLSLFTKTPNLPIKIMADGKLLWRVFDNLLNNICQYAQPSTRVYLDIEEEDRTITISFKNVSKNQLNISAEELMERFVRGDSSRNTEGSGLGLSIAKSLTELQHGEMNLIIDGDFFKVILVFQKL